MEKEVQKDIIKSIQDVTRNADLDNNLEVKVSVNKKRGKLPPNIMVFQTFAYLSATQLKPATNKVLMFFFSISGYENYVGMDVSTIQEELKMSKPTVVNSLKELESNNIIIKTPNLTDKRRNDYFINPLSAWKGNSYTRKQKLKEGINNNLQISMFDKEGFDSIKTDSDLFTTDF